MAKGMKILVIVPDAAQYGGTSTFLERLLDIHARQGVVTTLLVPEGRSHPSLVSLAQKHGAELLRSPNRATPDTAPFLTPILDLLFSWRAVASRRPDLVVVSTGDPGRMSVALYFPVPVLYILHSTPEYGFRLLPRWYMGLGARLGNRVMTVSQAAAEEVCQTMGVPRSRISVVHNSCRSPERLQGEPGPLVILTAGHLVAYKDPWTWLEVARTVLQGCPSATFVWLGDGELLQELRARARELCLEDRILFPGYHADPTAWFVRARIYLQPSLRESHGIAVLEAMSHGLPCVVAAAGGLPESVLNNETGYVCAPRDVAGFTDRILALLRDTALRSRLGTAGRVRAEEIFSETAQERKILALYDRLTGKLG